MATMVTWGLSLVLWSLIRPRVVSALSALSQVYSQCLQNHVTVVFFMNTISAEERLLWWLAL